MRSWTGEAYNTYWNLGLRLVSYPLPLTLYKMSQSRNLACIGVCLEVDTGGQRALCLKSSFQFAHNEQVVEWAINISGQRPGVVCLLCCLRSLLLALPDLCWFLLPARPCRDARSCGKRRAKENQDKQRHRVWCYLHHVTFHCCCLGTRENWRMMCW